MESLAIAVSFLLLYGLALFIMYRMENKKDRNTLNRSYINHLKSKMVEEYDMYD